MGREHKRRTLLRTFGVGLVGTAVPSMAAATNQTAPLESAQTSVQFDWEDGTKQGWETVEVEDGQHYRYGYSGHVYEFTIVEESIAGAYSPQIECLNDGIYVQSPDLAEVLEQPVTSVEAAFRLEGDLNASDSNSNRIRLNGSDGDRNGYVRFDHENMRIEWRGGEPEVLESFEAGTVYEIAITAGDESFTVSIDGQEYTGLQPEEGREPTIHTVEMRSVNWGGVGPSVYDESIRFTWDELTATAETAEEPLDGTDAYDEFQDGLDCWETSGNVDIAANGVVGTRSMRLDDETRSRATWDCAGRFTTAERVEFRGIYRVNEAPYQHRFRLSGEDDDVLLLINTSEDAIYLDSRVLEGPGSHYIDEAFIDEWAVFRLRVADGTVRVKVWPYHDAEPSEWQLSEDVGEFEFEFSAGVGGNDHGRVLLVDLLEADTDPESGPLGEPYVGPTEEPTVSLEPVGPSDPHVHVYEEVALEFELLAEGELSDDRSVTLLIDGADVDSTTIDLDGTGPVGGSVSAGPFEHAGEYPYSIETTDDTLEGVITVSDESYVRIAAVDYSSDPIAPGEERSIALTLENPGPEPAVTPVLIGFDTELVDETEVELEGGGEWTTEFTVSPDDSGEYPFQIETDEDSYTGTVIVTDDGDETEGETDGDDNGAGSDGDDDETVFELESDAVPGPGLFTTVATLGGTAYLVSRRSETDDGPAE